MIPVPSTNLGPSGGEGSSRGQGKVKAQIVSGMTVCMLSDCTTLPVQAHSIPIISHCMGRLTHQAMQ